MQFIEGQTHFCITWHEKVSLTLNELIQSVLRSNLHATSKDAPKTLLNMEGIVCITTNLQPKVMLS